MQDLPATFFLLSIRFYYFGAEDPFGNSGGGTVGEIMQS